MDNANAGQIKATAVLPTMEFVMFTLGKDVYRHVLERLTERQQTIFRKRMNPDTWLKLPDFIAFTRAVLMEVYHGDISKAEELGRASAEYGMSSFLKIFLRFGNVGFFVRKATSVFATYYQPARMVLRENLENRASVQVIGLYDEDNIMKHRICGFIRNLVEKSGCKNVQIRFEQEQSGSSFMIYCTWD